MRHAPLPLSLALALLAGAPAHADEFHFESFRYGQRAMGMGGAVTGLAIEPGAAWYNPAGLARLRGAEFSGALNIVGYQRQTVKGGMRDADFFEPRDVTSAGFAPTPTTGVASVNSGRHSVALTSFLVSDSQSSFSGKVTEPFAELGYEEVRFTLRDDRSSRQTMRGLTYAYRLSDEWAVGVSGYWLASVRSRRQRRGQFLLDTDVLSNDFFDLTTEDRVSTHSGVARVGVLWTPQAAYSAGAACTTPSLTVAGSATYKYTVATSGEPDAEDDSDGPAYLDEQVKVDARTVTPAHCRLGGAVQLGRWLLAADVSMVFPISYTRYDVSDTLDDLFADEVRHVLTVNGAVGAEVPLTPRWPLRAGLFTNRSSAPSVPTQPSAFTEPHVDYYGATLSLGYLGEKRSINFGVEAQLGYGHDAVSASVESFTDGEAFARLDRQEWRVVFFMAGAAAFARAAGTALLKGAD